MTRESEIIRSDLEREWPHHVALATERMRDLKNGAIVRGFASALSVAPLTYSVNRADVDLVVFCFDKPEDAEAFCDRFGGECRALPHH
jgi:hypothetical protein